MKISTLACALICFLAAPQSTKCQQFKGLQQARIIIEPIGKVDETMGLSPESLKDQILVALKRDIPKLKIVDSPIASYVYLQINSVQTGTNSVSTCVDVTLARPVEIIGDDGSKYFALAPVWNTGVIVHDSPAQMPSHIREQISQAMTALAAAYYKDNP